MFNVKIIRTEYRKFVKFYNGFIMSCVIYEIRLNADQWSRILIKLNVSLRKLFKEFKAEKLFRPFHIVGVEIILR